MRIRFTSTARDQFLEILRFIRLDKPEAARRFRKKSESQLRRLRDFPETGRKLPEYPELPFREILVTPCRFFYRVQGRTIWVVAVWHDAQLPESPIP